MSNHFPHNDIDFRLDRGALDPRRPSLDFHRGPRDSFASPSSSSRGSAAMPQDNVLSLLSSCGLEPDDLARLAALPEDVLTVDALPHILNQMKGQRENTPQPLRPSSSVYPSNNARRPPAGCDKVRDHARPSYGSGQTERFEARRNSSSLRADRQTPPFGYVTDTDHRGGPSHFGKNTYRDRRPRYSEPRHHRPPPPPRYEPRRRPKPDVAFGGGGSGGSQPSKKQALDFQGTPPVSFPYSCSLCDITVLSVKVWLQHVNSTQHADGQLNLLQQFPSWDCRIESSREDSQSERLQDEGKAAPSAPTATAPQASKGSEKKERGKVVCVKFPPQSVDETYLRKLTEPFGKIVKILMFPSLAFVELSSVDQAKDLVKFHVNYPPTVNGKQMEFSISNTFTFLQNSQVVSFTPPPAGDDGCSDLIGIVKRFGAPLYTLFLPSQALVEMKNMADAQKLVDYYSSNTLRINDNSIKVAFSADYKSLERISLAVKYRDKSRKSPDSCSSTESKRPRRDRPETTKEPENRSRSSSRDKSTRPTWTASGPEESQENPDGDTKEDGDRTEEKVEVKVEVKMEEEVPAEEEEDTGLSVGDSDIEGLEVIGEDDEGLEVEDEDPLLEEMDVREDDEGAPGEAATIREEEEHGLTAGVQEEQKQEEEDQFPLDLENCITLDELAEDELTEDTAETQQQGPNEEEEDESRDLSRVLCFSNLPLRYYTDAQFIALVQGLGTPVRYLLNRNQQEGFLEMTSSLEAVRAATSLSCKPPTLNGSKLSVLISPLYTRLSHGLEVQPGNDAESRSANKRKRKQRQRAAASTEHEPSGKGPEIEPQETPRNGPSIAATPEETTQDETTKENKEDTMKENEETLDKTTENKEDTMKEETLDKTTENKEDTMKENEETLDKTTENKEDTMKEKETLDKTTENKEDTMKENEETLDKMKENKEDTMKEKETPREEASPERTDKSEAERTNPEGETLTEQVSDSEGTSRSEAPTPSRPVGGEFVKPVVGYFCNLCQLIFASEDEAKLQHCSTTLHYSRYQEKTGKDPWTT